MMTSLNKSRPNHFLKRDSEKLCNKVDKKEPKTRKYQQRLIVKFGIVVWFF